MKISLEEFANWHEPLPVVVNSIDNAGYLVMVIIDGKEHLLTGKDNKALRHHSLMGMREALAAMPIARMSLRHQSAYDEMIGQPQRLEDNTLEVPLALEPGPAPPRH